MPRRVILSVALVAAAGLAAWLVYHRLATGIVSQRLTNKAVLIRGYSVVFPVCIDQTALGQSERFPDQPDPKWPPRC